MAIALPKGARVLLAGGAVLTCLIAQAAFGQGRCDARQKIVSLLDEKYGERAQAVGVTGDGRLIEVFASADGRTWTIIVTNPQGLSCLLAAGEGWRARKPATPET